MNQIAPVTEGRKVSPQQQFRDELTRMGDQFVAALPDHIKPERFQRIVLTAVLGDANLLRADRKTLLESAMRAAQDGLLPDKREGAFVVFNTKVKINGKDQWINAVQWMPMISGIIKKMHQSGEIAMLTAKVVYGGDMFRAWVDDDGEHVAYEQAEHPDYDTIRQVFALAKTKDGSVYVETLTPRDIEKIRSVSRSKDRGPWVQWWEEMAKKSAIRRLAKRLPLSADMHDLIQRDNELYDLSRAPDPQPSLRDRLNAAKPQALTDQREGFSNDFDRTDAHAMDAEIEDETSSDAPSSAENGSGDPAPDAAAGESEDQESGQSEEAGGDNAPASEPADAGMTDQDRTWLTQTARMLWAATGVGEQEVLTNQFNAIREHSTPAEITKPARDKGMAILKACKLVCFGEADSGDTLELIAGIAGVKPKDLVNG